MSAKQKKRICSFYMEPLTFSLEPITILQKDARYQAEVRSVWIHKFPTDPTPQELFGVFQ